MHARHRAAAASAASAAFAAFAGFLVWILCALPAQAQAGATERECAQAPVRVLAQRQSDHADICTGAAAAVAFFERLNLRPTEPLVLEVTARLPPEAGPTAAGCYLRARQRVYLLPYADFRRHKTWFGVPIDRAMYRSLAAHEAAHALAGCGFTLPRPTIQAQEYLAYVVMFATMEPTLRTRALRATPGKGFDSEARITPLLYQFDPMRFGAEAWRHYLKPEAGDTVLRAVLAGQALTD